MKSPTQKDTSNQNQSLLPLSLTDNPYPYSQQALQTNNSPNMISQIDFAINNIQISKKVGVN